MLQCFQKLLRRTIPLGFLALLTGCATPRQTLFPQPNWDNARKAYYDEYLEEPKPKAFALAYWRRPKQKTQEYSTDFPLESWAYGWSSKKVASTCDQVTKKALELCTKKAYERLDNPRRKEPFAGCFLLDVQCRSQKELRPLFYKNK